MLTDEICEVALCGRRATAQVDDIDGAPRWICDKHRGIASVMGHPRTPDEVDQAQQ